MLNFYFFKSTQGMPQKSIPPNNQNILTKKKPKKPHNSKIDFDTDGAQFLNEDIG